MGRWVRLLWTLKIEQKTKKNTFSVCATQIQFSCALHFQGFQFIYFFVFNLFLLHVLDGSYDLVHQQCMPRHTKATGIQSSKRNSRSHYSKVKIDDSHSSSIRIRDSTGVQKLQTSNNTLLKTGTYHGHNTSALWLWMGKTSQEWVGAARFWGSNPIVKQLVAFFPIHSQKAEVVWPWMLPILCFLAGLLAFCTQKLRIFQSGWITLMYWFASPPCAGHCQPVCLFSMEYYHYCFLNPVPCCFFLFLCLGSTYIILPCSAFQAPMKRGVQ